MPIEHDTAQSEYANSAFVLVRGEGDIAVALLQESSVTLSHDEGGVPRYGLSPKTARH